MEYIPLLEAGQSWNFEAIRLSETEIIRFAGDYDPLEFHTNIEYAEKSWFRGLIASGPHPFNVFYKTQWVPRFGKTVICGLELNKWRFLKPVYADQEVFCVLTVSGFAPNPEKEVSAVSWHFRLHNERNEAFQELEMKVLHHFKLS